MLTKGMDFSFSPVSVFLDISHTFMASFFRKDDDFHAYILIFQVALMTKGIS